MAKVEKLVKKFGIVFKDNNYYEAHQVTRTIYYRWLEAGEYEKLTQFLFERVLDFTKANETTIAFDLADLYVKTVSTAKFPVTDSRLDQIEKLVNTLATLVKPNESEDKKTTNLLIPITTALINWSIEFNGDATSIERHFGSERLNRVFAKAFESIQQLELARKHYVCSKDPQSYAKFVCQHHNQLIQSNTSKDAEELPEMVDDIFLTMVVLQVLCVGRLGTATKLLHLITEGYPKYSSRPPYTSALLNFTWLLTLCLQLRSMRYFTDLIESYKPILICDPRLLLYVDKIGQKFFGIPPPKQDPFGGGLLGNLLKGMTTKKEVPKDENALDFEPDDLEFLKEHKVTDQAYHNAWDAAASRNPPHSCNEPQFSDALEEQPLAQPVKKANAKAQADMDLD